MPEKDETWVAEKYSDHVSAMEMKSIIISNCVATFAITRRLTSAYNEKIV